MTTTVSRAIPSQPVAAATVRTPVELLRPPTPFVRQSPEPVVRAGYDLARRAVGYALEKVAFDAAVTNLLAAEPSQDVLRVAQDYLAFARLDVPLAAQVDAEFFVENAILRFERPRRRSLLRRK